MRLRDGGKGPQFAVWMVPRLRRNGRRWTHPRSAVVALSRVPDPTVRWSVAYRLLCVLAFAITVAVAIDEFGAGGRPWFGWWDSNVTIVGPYTIAISPRPGGAADRGGLVNGDLIDLRRQSVEGRVALLYQLMGTRVTTLTVDRRGSEQSVRIQGSSVWENATFWKLQPMVSRALLGMWLTLCALLLIVRREASGRARTLALVLLLVVGTLIDPSFFVVPNSTLSLVCLALSRACSAAAALLLIQMCSEVGTRNARRILIAYAARAVVLVALAADGAAVIGLATAAVDPLPFVLSISPARSLLDALVWLLVVLTGVTVRAQWNVLALPVALFVWSACFAAPAFVHSWLTNVAVIAVANAAIFAGVFFSVRRSAYA
jgi:hypothetical protein